MKKYLLILLAVVVLLLVFAYAKLFSRQLSYHKTIAASTSSVLILENFDMTNIKIVTADTDKIIVDLKGSPQDIAGVLYSEGGIFTKFGFSDDWSNISGTITVPSGMLIDVSLSRKSTITIDGPGGKKEIDGKDSFLVDTSSLNSFQISNSGSAILDAWGDLIVWDDEEWDVLEEGSDDEGQDGGDAGQPLYCGIGSQAIRDYCCVNENIDTDAPACDGLGHWIFDNSARDCGFVCEASESGEEDEEEEVVDCGVGGQTERNSCCASQHSGEYGGCVGAWKYNNAMQACDFFCYTDDDPNDDPQGGGGGGPASYGNPVSDYCATIVDDEDKSLCCNDTLKNNLSSGPRSGFPDCIGTWNFDVELGCAFECAEHSEMMEILNQLRQNAQN